MDLEYLVAVPIDPGNYRNIDGSDANPNASPNPGAAAAFLYGKDANGNWVYFIAQSDFGRKLWTAPGGLVEHGLNSSATMAQELYEETAGYLGFHPNIKTNVDAVKNAPVYKYFSPGGHTTDIYVINLQETYPGKNGKNMTEVLREIDDSGKFRTRAVTTTFESGGHFRVSSDWKFTSSYTEKTRWAAVPFNELCQFLLKSPTGGGDFSAYEIMINGYKNSIRDVDAKSLRAFFNLPAHEIARYLASEPMNILLSCKGPQVVSPRVVSPRAVSPRLPTVPQVTPAPGITPLAPRPISPRAARPRHGLPQPVMPRPVMPTMPQPVMPQPVMPQPVMPQPVMPVQAPSQVDNRPPCRYGDKCYRQNPQHLAEFRHPGRQ